MRDAVQRFVSYSEPASTNIKTVAARFCRLWHQKHAQSVLEGYFFNSFHIVGVYEELVIVLISASKLWARVTTAWPYVQR